MKRILAVTFTVFAFASQAFGDCGYTENCPRDGATMMKGECELNMHDYTTTCYYSHQANDGSTHSFYKTGCK